MATEHLLISVDAFSNFRSYKDARNVPSIRPGTTSSTGFCEGSNRINIRRYAGNEIHF